MLEWPLIGRAEELDYLSCLLLDPSSKGVVVAGPAGVGKTRLASECLRIADRSGFAVMHVTATKSASGLPLGAVAALLPTIEPSDAITTNSGGLLHRCAAAIVEQAGNRRLFLLVDDAHQLDDASATLIHQLVVGSAGFVLTTIRSGEELPDPITSLWKDGLVERIDLGSLSATEVHQLLALVLVGPVDHGSAAELFARSLGNILFLRELVVGALADGTLRQQGPLWRLTGPLAPSYRLVELIEARLRKLSSEQRAFLELVAFGEPLGSAEMAAMGDRAVAESLERMGLVSSRLSGRRLEIRLAHPIYGDVVRSAIPAIRLTTMASQLAEAIERTGSRRREDPLRVATWRLSCGGGQPELMLTAAETARWRYAYPLAEQLARAAVDAGAGFNAALLTAQLASLQGRNAAAEEALSALATHAATDAEHARIAVARLENFFWTTDFADGLAALEQAERAVTDSVWMDELSAARAWLAVGTEGPRLAVEATTPLISRCTGRTLVWACLTQAYSLIRMGRLSEGTDAIEKFRASSQADGVSLEWYPWFYTFTRSEALLQAGELTAAADFLSERYQQMLSDRSHEGSAFLVTQLARVSIARGLVRTAAQQALEGSALLREQGKSVVLRDCLASLALALAYQGRSAEATTTLREIEALDLSPALYSSCDILRAKAWTAAADNEIAKSCDLLEQAGEIGIRVGDLIGAAEALHGIVRLGHAKDVVARLTELAGQVEGDLVMARALHARAIVDGDAERLDEVVVRFEGMGANLLAAEAAADAAAAWTRAGSQRAAARAARRSQDLEKRCEGATTPVLRALLVAPLLTPAEREAALLAARGLANKSIAEHLGLTVRTIETRLQHVYEKLGITQRGDLAEALNGNAGATTASPVSSVDRPTWV
jgi:DNA-binding CsgD family transcriptional regulator